jgi:hypothetical protein
MNKSRWYAPVILIVFAFVLALPAAGLAETKKKSDKKATAKSVKTDKKEKAGDKSKDSKKVKKTDGDKGKEKKAKKKDKGKDEKAVKSKKTNKNDDSKKTREDEMKSTRSSGPESAETGDGDSRLHLNTASWADYIRAGFSSSQTGKIIAGRPWQRKSQLLDKGIMTEKEYETVKDGITAQ